MSILKLIADRIEENENKEKILMCEDFETEKIFGFKNFPGGVGEGDVLIFTGFELIPDPDETAARKKYIEELLKGL
jgi:hypothetical protein